MLRLKGYKCSDKINERKREMSIGTIILFATFVMMAYFIEGIIGFGGTIIALPLASAVVGMKLAVPVLTIVVFFASVVIAIRDFKFIDKKQFVKITSLMVLGLPVGMWLFSSLPERPLKIVLSIFMIFIGAKGLKASLFTNKAKIIENHGLEDEIAENSSVGGGDLRVKKRLSDITIFLGGIVHGAFTCGGPFVVVYATENIKDKSSFRATLCTLWAVLNGIMIVINIFAGDITGQVVLLSAWTIPFIILSVVVSNMVHKIISGDSFTIYVYGALIISGILMIIG